ncbi:MAG: hypothetical protein HZB29_10530 [Nitrospinae bacterium]|nr:hypothetical protein [Nitrospinota bacterium]
MSRESTKATSKIFLMAFKALSKKDKEAVVEGLLEDNHFSKDLMDIAIIEKRRHEPSRPLEEYLADRKKRKA